MSFTRKQVDDLETLRAMAHPLRGRLLGLLRGRGPATASELARRVGESSGSTSYHLRQLERFGFVEDDVDQPSGRERRWRATAESTSWSNDLLEGPGGADLFDAVRGMQMAALQRALGRWTTPTPGLGHSDFLLHLTPSEAGELTDAIADLVDSWRERSDAERPGTVPVNLHLLALPGDDG